MSRDDDPTRSFVAWRIDNRRQGDRWREEGHRSKKWRLKWRRSGERINVETITDPEVMISDAIVRWEGGGGSL
jgi:hypothetical protein